MNGSTQSVQSIQYESLLNTAASLKTYAADMEACLGNVTNELNQIGEGGIWSGDAANSVRNEFNKLSQNFDTYKEAILGCVEYLNRVYENYKALDTKIQQGLGK